jgi:hypothetical protein
MDSDPSGRREFQEDDHAGAAGFPLGGSLETATVDAAAPAPGPAWA